MKLRTGNKQTRGSGILLFRRKTLFSGKREEPSTGIPEDFNSEDGMVCSTIFRRTVHVRDERIKQSFVAVASYVSHLLSEATHWEPIPFSRSLVRVQNSQIVARFSAERIFRAFSRTPTPRGSPEIIVISWVCQSVC